MAILRSDSIDVPFDPNDPNWMSTELTAIENAQSAARAAAEGEYVGEILRWQRGDGYAFYLVARQVPLELIHIRVGDSWTIEDALIRGLTVKDVSIMVERTRAIGSHCDATTG